MEGGQNIGLQMDRLMDFSENFFENFSIQISQFKFKFLWSSENFKAVEIFIFISGIVESSSLEKTFKIILSNCQAFNKYIYTTFQQIRIILFGVKHFSWNN